MKKINLIIKPTHDCNFDCKYCYDKESKAKYLNKRMSQEMINKTIDILEMDGFNEVNLIWHGGEPTLMGMQWYKKVQSRISSSIVTINQFIQTNGSLLSEEWINFLEEHNIKLGVSYDFQGQVIRNKNDNVLTNIFSANKSKIKPGIICVVTNKNKEHLIKTYDQCKEQSLTISFNPLFNLHSNRNQLGDENSYVLSIYKLYKHIVYDNTDNAMYERNLENYLNLVSGKNSENYLCKFSNCLGYYLSINPLGEIYPCDREYSEIYKMGNIEETNSFIDIFPNSCIKKDQSRRKEKCKNCSYFLYCLGGCNADHLSNDNNAGEINEDYCHFFKEMFNQAFLLLKEINPYQDKLNPYFWMHILGTSLILPWEIESFLKNKGYVTVGQLNDNGDVIDSLEFKLFEAFNQYQRLNPITNQVNYYEPNIDYDVIIDKDFDLSKVKNERLKVIEELFTNNSLRILSMVQ